MTYLIRHPKRPMESVSCPACESGGVCPGDCFAAARRRSEVLGNGAQVLSTDGRILSTVGPSYARVQDADDANSGGPKRNRRRGYLSGWDP